MSSRSDGRCFTECLINAMKTCVLTVTLNPALDVTWALSGFRAGHDFYKNKQTVSAGGKGLNVSRTLQVLRVPNVATGFVGGDAGKTIKTFLKEEQIKLNFVDISATTRTNITIVAPNDRYQTRILEKGQRVYPGEVQRFKEKYCSLLRRSNFVVLSGRNADGASDQFYARLIRLAKRQGIPVLLDTSGVPLKEGLAAGPDIIKPNLSEAEFIFGKKIKTKIDIRRFLQKCHKAGVKTVLLSMAQNGAVLSDNNEVFIAKPSFKNIQNDVGCGDAMVAGFIYGLMKNFSPEDQLRWAVALGTANGLNLKPGLMTRQEVTRILKNIRVNPF
ncbi:MAG: 1-phosphofructokinase family hexose kinase [Candidatus Omnitrophica bacterium]|nr:1-phosphofructokinase family hexose kinase [Candidatus Omnitrophota bacterium]